MAEIRKLVNKGFVRPTKESANACKWYPAQRQDQLKNIESYGTERSKDAPRLQKAPSFERKEWFLLCWNRKTKKKPSPERKKM
jgi:hypothetical protein